MRTGTGRLNGGRGAIENRTDGFCFSLACFDLSFFLSLLLVVILFPLQLFITAVYCRFFFKIFLSFLLSFLGFFFNSLFQEGCNKKKSMAAAEIIKEPSIK